jgi:hypothetical protein
MLGIWLPSNPKTLHVPVWSRQNRKSIIEGKKLMICCHPRTYDEMEMPIPERGGDLRRRPQSGNCGELLYFGMMR